ncbi:hypothetical protein [Natrononativus amylolyticus]|uniref:hypothetical protein n=1 Tax=Natrononativus amylolyticus TaxID=2963434 RepID=UPI0020CDFB9E|nr:hypothetical protein [Natrononativus amylolyticus]
MTDATAQSGGDGGRPKGQTAIRAQAATETVKKQATERVASSLQQQVENTLAEEIVRLPVGGEQIKFDTFDGPTSDRVATVEERIARMDVESFEEKYAEEVRWMCKTLGEAAEPKWMTASWFYENFSIKKRREYLNLIQAEEDLMEADIKKRQRRNRGGG